MSRQPISLLNGKATNTPLIESRGLAYGDGLFETLVVVRGQLLWLDEHLCRLQVGAERLQLSVDVFALKNELEKLLLLSENETDGVVKLIVYRRSAGRGYTPASRDSERILQYFPGRMSQKNWQDGIRTVLCQQRLARQPNLAGIKHLNRLENVLASAEIQRQGCDEGLMLDESGLLVEASRSNVFLVKNGVLQTPRLDSCGVAGIMRSKLLEQAAALNLVAKVVDLRLSKIYEADELFVCNSVFGIWPVTAVGCHLKPIGDVTRRLQKEFKAAFDV